MITPLSSPGTASMVITPVSLNAMLPEHILGGMTTEEIVNYEPYNRGAIGTGPFTIR